MGDRRGDPGGRRLHGDLTRAAGLTRFSGPARNAIVASREEARRMRSAKLGTAHLVLGLLREPEGLAARALAAQGVTLAQARARAEAGAAAAPASVPRRIRFAPQARRTFELALREAPRRGDTCIGTEHLLLAVLAEGGGDGARLLRELRVSEQQARAFVDGARAGPATAAG